MMEKSKKNRTIRRKKRLPQAAVRGPGQGEALERKHELRANARRQRRGARPERGAARAERREAPALAAAVGRGQARRAAAARETREQTGAARRGAAAYRRSTRGAGTRASTLKPAPCCSLSLSLSLSLSTRDLFRETLFFATARARQERETSSTELGESCESPPPPPPPLRRRMKSARRSGIGLVCGRHALTSPRAASRAPRTRAMRNRAPRKPPRAPAARARSANRHLSRAHICHTKEREGFKSPTPGVSLFESW